MKFSKLFLFYYGLIVTTILLPVSYFLLPKPQNMANTILLIPVVFLFWSYAANPGSLPIPKWSQRFVIIVSILCLLGIFSYFLSVRYFPNTPISNESLGEIKKSLNQSDADEKEFRSRLEGEISILRMKIDSLGNRDLNVIGVTAPSESPTLPDTAIGQITAKDANLTKIAIYETSSPESKSVGSAEYGVVYPFYEKSGDWYKITQGWVEARWFTEVNP